MGSKTQRAPTGTELCMMFVMCYAVGCVHMFDDSSKAPMSCSSPSVSGVEAMGGHGVQVQWPCLG